MLKATSGSAEGLTAWLSIPALCFTPQIWCQLARAAQGTGFPQHRRDDDTYVRILSRPLRIGRPSVASFVGPVYAPLTVLTCHRLWQESPAEACSVIQRSAHLLFAECRDLIRPREGQRRYVLHVNPCLLQGPTRSLTTARAADFCTCQQHQLGPVRIHQHPSAADRALHLQPWHHQCFKAS